MVWVVEFKTRTVMGMTLAHPKVDQDNRLFHRSQEMYGIRGKKYVGRKMNEEELTDIRI